MVNRRGFLKGAAGTLLAASVFPGLSLRAETVESLEYLGPSLRQVIEWTTLHKKLVMKLPRRKITLALERAMAGEAPLVRNDLLPTAGELRSNPRSLLFFGHISDSHLIDEESPARVVAAEPYLELIGVRSAFHPQEDLTLQVCDAMIRTIDRIAEITPLHFMLDTGDSIDNANGNELDWLLDVLEGKMVNPDSGGNEDPVAGPNNDGNDPFAPAGLLRNIPYYSAIGNHDVLLQGNVPISLREFYNSIVKKYLDCMLISTPTGDTSNAVVTPWAKPPDPAKLKPGKIIPDARRQPREGREFIGAFLTYPTFRPVLGFPPYLFNREYGYYTFRPRNGLPLKVIVLDTTSRLGTALGVIGEMQYREFLIPELEKAKKERELVIVASHHPGSGLVRSDNFREEATKEYRDDPVMYAMVNELVQDVDRSSAYVSAEDLKDTLKSYPNVFLYVAGHDHRNAITPIGGSGRGYWEVLTSSLMNYPQQSRLLEIVYEGNGVGAIHTCVVDHDSKADSLAAYSRQLAYLDDKGHRAPAGEGAGNASDRNAVLRFSIPPEIAEKL